MSQFTLTGPEDDVDWCSQSGPTERVACEGEIMSSDRV